MRLIKLKPNELVTKCPKCGNNTDFKAHSNQITEDCCNVWVECICGFDPTALDTDYRHESVMGGTGWDEVRIALDCWNQAIKEQCPKCQSNKITTMSKTYPEHLGVVDIGWECTACNHEFGFDLS